MAQHACERPRCSSYLARRKRECICKQWGHDTLPPFLPHPLCFSCLLSLSSPFSSPLKQPVLMHAKSERERSMRSMRFEPREHNPLLKALFTRKRIPRSDGRSISRDFDSQIKQGELGCFAIRVRPPLPFFKQAR